MENCKVNILGTEYDIKFKSVKDDHILSDMDGYTDESIKTIIVDDMSNVQEDSKKNLTAYQKRVIRHEIIHAFLIESGMDGNGNKCDHWELNEEMVDWFAIQSPKIFKVFQEINIL